MTLRVAVNLTWIAPGRVGGSEEYLDRQLLGLPPDAFDVELFASPSFLAAHPALAARYSTKPSPNDRDSRSVRIALEHTWLARRTRHADVVHHGGGTTPLIGRRPIVLTVHDLQYLAFPHYFGPGRRRYLEAMMPRSVARAAIVTTPSEFVAATVVEAFDIDAGRVVVVPHGIPDIGAPTPVDILAARRRLGLDDRPYVVYPAITHPHKGHQVLIRMLDHLSDEIVLVLLGGEGAAEAALTTAIEASRQSARVIRPGRVSESDRNSLLAGASALVFPSEYEGFGAPLVEAMELGTPVVCSGAAAVREVVADAAVVVAEPTGSAWAAGVTTAIEQTVDLVARGRTRRRQFTLATSGEALAHAYDLAANS